MDKSGLNSALSDGAAPKKLEYTLIRFRLGRRETVYTRKTKKKLRSADSGIQASPYGLIDLFVCERIYVVILANIHGRCTRYLRGCLRPELGNKLDEAGY